MAIICYTGVMGSGKTYEAVGTAMVTALRQGRRVVSNISGLNFDNIRDYVGPLKDGSHLEPDRLVVVPSSRITEPDFFPDPEREGLESVVQGGDLVLIDEVWAFWGTDCKLSPEHQRFFRMHRHYTETSSGVSCDLVIMIQDLTSLHRFIRGVLETNFKFKKLKSVGIRSGYSIDVYEGSKQVKTSFISHSINRYDKKVFPLYKSYDGDKQGKEAVVDDRQNLFKNKFFLAGAVTGLSLLIFCGWKFVALVGHYRNSSKSAAPVAAAASGVRPSFAASSPSGPSAADPRLVGVVSAGSSSTAWLQYPDGTVVQVPFVGGVIDGARSRLPIDGHFVVFRHTVAAPSGSRSLFSK